MSRLARLLVAVVAVAVATFAVAGTAGSQAPPAAGAMQLTMSIHPIGGDEQTVPDNVAIRAGGTVTITFRNYTHRFHTFTIRALGVSAEVEQQLASRGILEPFRIQSLVVPDALAGRDVLGKAPTGSGKTLAFGLPLVESISPEESAPAALVLVPTRELALQVTEELSLLGAPKHLRAAAAYGGAPVAAQAKRPRGAPALVRDSDGRVRCVACQLCEFICPPRAIKIIPGEIPPSDRFAKVEKFPEEFDIDMIRCIYCGMCEEVCPEQAIYLRKDYAITGFTRADMVHHKEKLLEIGGVMHGVVLKWNEKK